jgi:Tol biopolymer transport system component
MKEKEQPDSDEKPAAGAPPKPPKPIIIDRYHFKQDKEGYLSGAKHNHVYIFDIESDKLDQLTTDKMYDETDAVWSADGTKIAFVRNHDKDPDHTENSDVFVADARPGTTSRKLTNYPGPDSGPLSWSSDSKLIAYLQGSESKFTAYSMNRLAVVPADGGASRVLTQRLDRGISFPVFTHDAAAIMFLVADDRSEYPAKVAAGGGGAVERLTGGPLVVSTLSSAGGHTAALAASDQAPPEVFALDGGSLRKLTRHNEGLVSELQLGAVEDISFMLCLSSSAI